jgi:hypothetical protein
VPISGRLLTVKAATKFPPGTPLPEGKLGPPFGWAALLSPSSWLPAGSVRLLASMVSV